jgi:hypothetical protein
MNICNFWSNRRENTDSNSSSLVSLVSPCVCVWISTIAPTQRLGKHVTAETNTHATIQEFFDPSFSMRSVLPLRKLAISSSQNFLRSDVVYINYTNRLILASKEQTVARRVVEYTFSDISEERIASISRIEANSNQETKNNLVTFLSCLPP